MKHIFLFCFLASSASATISNVVVLGTTATQAVIQYGAPNNSPCNVEISESPTYLPLVYDVDNSKFASASSDARPGSITNGVERRFVAGKRAAEVGLDTVRYSRALQTATQHYFRISCPSTGDKATGTFQTMTIPFGNTYAEPQAIDTSQPGKYALPTLSTSDRTQRIIDPQTGLLIKTVSLPQDVFAPVTGVPLSVNRSAAWTNLPNLASADGKVATVSAGTGNLFMALDPASPYFNFFTPYAAAYQNPSTAFGYYQVNLIAAVNKGSTVPANPDDAKVVACLTVDGVSCYPGSSQYETALTSSLANYVFGSTNTIDLWQSTPGAAIPNWPMQVPRSGTVTCDGSQNVTLTAGSPFSITWAAGSTININGTDYAIATLNHTASLSLKSTCPSGSYPYISNNFGVLIHKKTASADTISIDYGSVNYVLNFYFPFTTGGGNKLCAATTVTGPNGTPGYNCAMPSGNMYWIDAQSGESHLFSNESTSPNVGCASDSQIFDPNDPDSYYCGGTGVLYKTKYYGNHSEPVTLNPAGNIQVFQNLKYCNTKSSAAPYASQQPCIVTTPLTPGTNIGIMAAAFTSNPAYAPAFDPTVFTNVQFKDVDDSGNALIHIWRGGHNSIAWLIAYNPTATSNSEGGTSMGAAGNHGCVGGGTPGCVIGAMPGWARPGCRWCTMKSGDSPYPGWTDSASYIWGGGVGQGPYYVPVINGGANGTSSVLDGTTSLQACPANSYGATGKNCTSMTIGSEPLSPNHGSGETGLPGEIGNSAVGDYFSLAADGSGELMRLIVKTPGSVSGTWVYVLQRDITRLAANHVYAISSANPNLYAVCGANQFPLNTDAGGTWYWNFLADPHGMNSTGLTIPGDPNEVNNHYFWLHGNGGFASATTNDPRCSVAFYFCYSTRLVGTRSFQQTLTATPTTGVQTQNPAFGSGAADFSNTQSHPTGGGERASADRFNYMFDGRPYRGGYSSGSAGGSGSNPATVIGGQLYKFPASAMVNIDVPFRKVYPTAAFSGQAPLVDISSPATGNIIGITGSDSYKYCVAAVANECRQGSSIGDVFVNAPNVRYPYCFQAAQNLNLSEDYDLCIGGSPMVRDAVMQIDMSRVDNEGRFQRVLTKFSRPRVLSVFYTPYVLPNGQWMVFEAQLAGDGNTNKSLLVAKIPPPSPADTYNRGNFIPISLQMPAIPGANQAYVRFGYAESGPWNSLFCTSRAEICVSGSQSSPTPVDPKNPFYFEQTEAGKWSGMACTTGCTLVIPSIPQRVLYYQYVYTNGPVIVYTSPVTSTVVP